MEAINGVTLGKYAELCALMADTAGDESKEIAIAEANGVSAEDWRGAKAGYTKKMSDPTDLGKTALAFIPLLQAAQSNIRGGKEPCSLETYSKVHAGMAFRKDPTDPSKKLDYKIVLEENGFTHQSWLECENYWTPMVNYDPRPELNQRFNAELCEKFKQLFQQESDLINGIKR